MPGSLQCEGLSKSAVMGLGCPSHLLGWLSVMSWWQTHRLPTWHSVSMLRGKPEGSPLLAPSSSFFLAWEGKEDLPTEQGKAKRSWALSRKHTIGTQILHMLREQENELGQMSQKNQWFLKNNSYAWNRTTEVMIFLLLWTVCVFPCFSVCLVNTVSLVLEVSQKAVFVFSELTGAAVNNATQCLCGNLLFLSPLKV